MLEIEDPSSKISLEIKTGREEKREISLGGTSLYCMIGCYRKKKLDRKSTCTKRKDYIL